ncbi:MAG: SIS domain-containing protein [Candidatus Coatesbacteria bacterium]|nr:SIS domain-containing protein [Candidatus Coatesbacteria bacterium]
MRSIARDVLVRLVKEKSEESADLTRAFVDAVADAVAELVQQLAQRLNAGGKLLLFGNGGSAADAQHIAAEFVNRLSIEHPALPAIALTTDTSVLTSIANDRSFEEVFSRQIEALGREGDVAWGISTSGRSPNVLRALSVAKSKKMMTIFSTGEGGKNSPVDVDFLFAVPHRYSPRVQEVYMVMAHVTCELLEKIMFGEKNG